MKGNLLIKSILNDDWNWWIRIKIFFHQRRTIFNVEELSYLRNGKFYEIICFNNKKRWSFVIEFLGYTFPLKGATILRRRKYAKINQFEKVVQTHTSKDKKRMVCLIKEFFSFFPIFFLLWAFVFVNLEFERIICNI